MATLVGPTSPPICFDLFIETPDELLAPNGLHYLRVGGHGFCLGAEKMLQNIAAELSFE